MQVSVESCQSKFVVHDVMNSVASKDLPTVYLESMRSFYYYFTYRDEILNLEGYIFEKFFTTKKLWDGLQVFRKQPKHRVRIEMR